ncbi:MBL fold metallo-hydrolase [Streptomyces sp. NPDC046727]|uniref:MBL fold metallo-hydrolase n=1 Tax=Streptomyces sp. NPDC046727 TaxID=3155373 RepID=UPI0033C2B56A
MTVTWEELGWERLATGVGRCRLPGWDCTAGLVLGAGTALAVDAGSSLAEGARLRARAEELAGGRVTHLALTHPHFDHVLGTPAFAGTQVYAAVGLDAVLAYEREELRLDAIRNGLAVADADESVAALVPPGHLVSGEWTLDLGDGRQALLANVGPGHTAHDLAVLVPGDPEVVFCGDLVEESGEPQAGPDAIPSRWPDALDRLLALGGEDALYVPGHGAVVDAGFVRRQREQLAARFGVS